MATIELKRARIPSDVTVHLYLSDNDVAVSWRSLEEIKVRAFSVEQRAFAGECEWSIDSEDDTRLNVIYRGSSPQFPGTADLVVFCKYHGRLKSYNVPVVYLVKSTEEVTGYQVIDDPEVDVAISVEDTSEVSVHLEVEDVSTSLLDQAIEDAEAAAALANEKADEASSAAAGAAEAASLAREKAQAANSAAGRANAAATRANNAADFAIAAGQHQPKIGDNGNWFIWDVTEDEYIDTLVHAQGPKGDTGDPAGFGEVTAEVDANVGAPSVSVETSGPNTAKNFHFAFSNLKGNKGDKGNTPVLTADEDGTIYADGEVLTEVIKEAKETADDDHSRAESDHERAEDDHESIADKADVDGWYSGMTVGLAENLIDTRGEGADQEFLLRKSCGDKSITDRGNALIQRIYGKTVVWNQLVSISNMATSSYGVAITVSGNKITLSGTVGTGGLYFNFANTINYISGHKYLLVCPPQSSAHFYIQWSGINKHASNGSLIQEANSTTSGNSILRADEGAVIDWTGYIQCIDLTLLTGITTVADFEKFYNRPYYAFNAGTLLNNKAAAIELVGFNHWDEVWESGSINTTTGQNEVDTTMIRSKNYIPVFGSNDYYVRIGSKTLQVFQYDSAKNLITGWNSGYSYKGYAVSAGLTTQPNCAYLRFRVTQSATYNHDICINLSDANRNGEYEPYTLTTLRLDLTTLTGKLNGEGESVVIVPDGLCGAGTAHDEGIVENGYLTRIRLHTAVRPYQSGDEDNAAYVTDMTNTVVPLAEPLEYVLDTPIPATYAVENGGTERILPDGVDEQGVPATAPFNAKILYSTNFPREIANLPQNYISKESAVNLLEALKSAGVISAYTMTFVNGVYTFTITA